VVFKYYNKKGWERFKIDNPLNPRKKKRKRAFEGSKTTLAAERKKIIIF